MHQGFRPGQFDPALPNTGWDAIPHGLDQRIDLLTKKSFPLRLPGLVAHVVVETLDRMDIKPLDEHRGQAVQGIRQDIRDPGMQSDQAGLRPDPVL